MNHINLFPQRVTPKPLRRRIFATQYATELTYNRKGKHMGYPLTKGSWSEQKMKLKTKFASLTDNDLMYSDGKKVEMMMKLQMKLGKTREELQDILAGL